MKAETAIKTAPGVLAVKVDYATKQATIGIQKESEFPKAEILAALEAIGYSGELAKPTER